MLGDDGQRLGQSDHDRDQDLRLKIIDFCKEPKDLKDIVDFLIDCSIKIHCLERMLEEGKLKMTISDKPSSKNQKYYS